MALDRRQKILLPLIILAFAYIAWQLYDLIFSDSSDASNQSSLRHSAMVRPAYAPHAASHEIKGKTPASIETPQQPVPEASEHSLFVSTEKQVAQPAVTAEQSEYLRLVNRYNLLKLKHMLLEEEAAIAAAKQRIVKSRSEIVSMGGNSELVGEDDFDLEGGKLRSGYELVYLDYQNGRWNALLNRGGRFFEVYQGTQIVNGDQIVNVSKEGVVVNHKDQLFLVNFDGSRSVSEDYKKTGSSGMSEEEIIEHLNAQKAAGIKVDQAVFPPGMDKDEELDRLTAIEKRIAVPYKQTPDRVTYQQAPAQQIPVRVRADDKALAGVNPEEDTQMSKAPSTAGSNINPLIGTTPTPASSAQKEMSSTAQNPKPVIRYPKPAVQNPKPMLQDTKSAEPGVPIAPSAKNKLSSSVGKAQKWFSGIWSNQAEKNKDAVIEVIEPQAIEKQSLEKKKTLQLLQQQVLSESDKKSLPEPFLLSPKEENKKPLTSSQEILGKKKTQPKSGSQKISESFGVLKERSGEVNRQSQVKTSVN